MNGLNVEETGGITKALDFNMLVSMQINRIAETMSKNTGDILAPIETLEVLLSAFEDSEYLDELKEISSAVTQDRIKYATAKGKQLSQMDDMDNKTLMFISAKKKAKALMKLAHRQGFLIESSGEVSI